MGWYEERRRSAAQVGSLRNLSRAAARPLMPGWRLAGIIPMWDPPCPAGWDGGRPGQPRVGGMTEGMLACRNPCAAAANDWLKPLGMSRNSFDSVCGTSPLSSPAAKAQPRAVFRWFQHTTDPLLSTTRLGRVLLALRSIRCRRRSPSGQRLRAISGAVDRCLFLPTARLLMAARSTGTQTRAMPGN
jgi:hypothetical protein